MWHLNSNHRGHTARLSLSMDSLNLCWWFQSLPVLTNFNNMDTWPFIFLWFFLRSLSPISSSPSICVSPAKMYVCMDITQNLPDLSVGNTTNSPDLLFNMLCQICEVENESQQHIFQCIGIRRRLNCTNFNELKYEMIFGKLEEQEKFTKVYHLMLQAREDLIKNSSLPSSHGGPVHR